METTKDAKKETKKTAKETKSKITKMDEAKVREFACRLYEMRGRANGDDWKDWFEAEKRVKNGKQLVSC